MSENGWKAKLEAKKKRRLESVKQTSNVKQKSKEECPFCGVLFKSVAHHLNYCDKNPENVKQVKQVESFSLLSDLERADLKTVVHHWIISYRRQVINIPNGENAEKMKRMLTYYKRLFGYEYKELKVEEFQEWIEKYYKIKEGD